MNKTILLFLIILMIPIAMALENCKGTMFENDIPCLILLPVKIVMFLSIIISLVQPVNSIMNTNIKQ